MQLIALLTVLAAAPSLDLLRDLPGLTSPPTEAVSTEMDGMVITHRSATSKRSVAELRQHFIKVFEKAGLFLPPEQDKWQPEIGEQVTGLDTENLINYTALLQPNGKSVTVVLAMGNLGTRKTAAPKDPGVPLYPGAGTPTQFNVEAMNALSYAAPGTPAQIKAFYREALPKTGYRELDGTLVFVKGNQQLTVVISPGVTERYVMIQQETRAASAPAVIK